MKQKKKTRGKPQGMTFADVLAAKKLQRHAIQEAANDATVEVRANTAVQRFGWLAVVSAADFFHVGPEKIRGYLEMIAENAKELEQMRSEVDEDYAYEKLRLKAERVSGVKIEYLYEHEKLAAEIKKAREAVDG